MGLQLFGDGSGEGIAVDGERSTCRKAVFLGHLHHEAACRPHLPVEEADGVLFVVVRAEGVRAHHLGEVAGAVGEGFHHWPHFVQGHGDAEVGCGPGGLGPGHAAADDVEWFGHAQGLGSAGAKGKGEHMRSGGQRPPSGWRAAVVRLHFIGSRSLTAFG